jgi:hypothetical protein
LSYGSEIGATASGKLARPKSHELLSEMCPSFGRPFRKSASWDRCSTVRNASKRDISTTSSIPSWLPAASNSPLPSRAVLKSVVDVWGETQRERKTLGATDITGNPMVVAPGKRSPSNYSFLSGLYTPPVFSQDQLIFSATGQGPTHSASTFAATANRKSYFLPPSTATGHCACITLVQTVESLQRELLLLCTPRSSQHNSCERERECELEVELDLDLEREGFT